jgi:hypothetical protein
MFSILIPAIAALLSLQPQSTTGYAVGDEVKNFSLTNIDGKNVSLNDYASREGSNCSIYLQSLSVCQSV